MAAGGYWARKALILRELFNSSNGVGEEPNLNQTKKRQTKKTHTHKHTHTYKKQCVNSYKIIFCNVSYANVL